MLFVFDGIDGGGKSTQISRLETFLESRRTTIVCKDPGSTALGESLRSILLNDNEMPIDMRSEMMLFSTARTQLVQEIVKPALRQGHFVVLDRFVMSTVVYQGHAGKLAPQDIRMVNQFATDGLKPAHTFVLDLPVEVAMERLGDTLDRMESRGTEYFRNVRQGFLHEAEQERHCSVIDATETVDQIAERIQAIVANIIQ
jgi:dTMP kinase